MSARGQEDQVVIDIDPNSVSVARPCGAAILCGAAVTLINFFWTVGQ